MGCTASKLDNEDTVRRCKERRRLMKEAVFSRHHLAAAHADYVRSLRLTGSALYTFAEGEPLSVSDQTPAVFLHPPNPPNPNPNPIPPSVPSRSASLRQQPPPLSPTMASSKLPHILSSSTTTTATPRRTTSLNKPKPKPKPKLPHILSDSSFSSHSPRSDFFPTAFQANSTYSRTPSQASSMWNWENFYPPSPPNSEFFNQRNAQLRNGRVDHPQQHHLDDDYEGEEEGTEKSEYDFFDRQKYREEEETETATEAEREREEVHCSEWGDHYSTTSSSDEEEMVGDDRDGDSRSEIGTRSNFGGTSSVSAAAEPEPLRKFPTRTKSMDAGSSAGSYRTGEISSENMKMVLRHKDLKEIVEAIKQNFDMAAAAGDQVSEMLEIGRAHFDRSFRQLKSERFPFYLFLN